MKISKKAPFFSVSLFGLLIVLAGISFAPSVVGAAKEIEPGRVSPAHKVLPTEIRGTVRINGWTGDVAHAFIHAMPVSFGSSSDTRMPNPGPPSQFRPLMRTADPHVFSFSIRGLLPHTPYRLGITVPPNPVRPREPIKTFWSGLPGGMATSGMPPVAIEGHVANTEVEVKDGNGNWVGADDLQYANPETALRTLRWKSNIPGVVAGELQISLNAYPTRGVIDPCEAPERGVIYRKQFSVREGGWQEIGNLDFSKILMPGRTLPPTDDEIPLGILPMDAAPADSSPADDITIGEPSDVAPISDHDLKMLTIGAPLYIRVVPVISGRGRACDLSEDGVHGWVILSRLPKGGVAAPEPPPAPEVSHLEVTTQTYTPPAINTWGDEYRKKGLVVYKFIKDHKLPPCTTKDYKTGKEGCPFSMFVPDYLSYEYNKTTKNWDKVHKYDALGQALIDAKNAWAKPDQIVTPKLPSGEPWLFVYWIEYGSCDFWCSAWDFSSGFVTGTISGIGGFVTWWAEAYASIKDGVASVVADVVTWLPVIGDACNAVVSCKDLIKAGMDYGLASMGLPPSLPNWEQLKQQGMDYLASEISQQMAETTGLPSEVTDLMVDKAKVKELAEGMAQQTIDAMTENRGKAFNGWGANWIVPFDGMEPASRTIKLVKKYPGEAPYAPFPLPSNLYLRTAGTGNFTDLWVNKVYPYQFTGNLYRPEDVHVPEFPNNTPIIINGYGSSLNIPIVLQPDYSTVPVPQCVDTMPAYDVKCSEVHLLPDNPFQPNGPSCWQSYGGYSPWKLVDCKNYETQIAIYYRDYWIENRLGDLEYSPCLQLSAVAYTLNWQELFTGNPWHLFDPPFGTFAFTPSEEANTWNGPFYVNPKCD